MQRSSKDGTDKLYELVFSEFISLLLRDLGIRNLSNYSSLKVRIWVKGKTAYKPHIMSDCLYFLRY